MKSFSLLNGLILLSIVLVCFSCETSKNTSALETANELILSKPDSSLKIIRNIDSASFHTSRWKAKYALTKAIALDKNYIDTTDAGFLLPALNYYKRFGSKEDLMRAYYYYGRIQYNNKDYKSAVVSFYSALDASVNVANPKFKGMIYGALADTHNKNHNNKDELKYALLAYNSMEDTGDSTQINLARYKLGIAYHNNRFLDKADSLLSLVRGNDYLVNEARIALSDNEIQKEPHSASRVISLIESTLEANGRMELKHYYEYAYALVEDGRTNDANQWISILSQYPDNAKTYWWKYKIAEHNKDYRTALCYLNSFSEASDSVVVKKLEQSLYKAQTEYYELKTDIADAKAQNARLNTIIIVMLSIIFVSFLFIVFKKRRQKIIDENNQLRLQQEEAVRMVKRLKRQGKAEKDKYEAQLSELRTDFARMYRKQFDEIIATSANHFDPSTLSEKAKKAYSEKYSALITELIDPQKQNEFETRLNDDLDDIMKKLRTDFPEFSEVQFRFLTYIIAGFDASSLAFLLNTSKNNVWVRKSRLKDRIFNSSSTNKDLYGTFII